jgi:hypothetical protein
LQALKYRSGEEIKTGDRVLFHGNEAAIELVACEPGDPATDWYLDEFGGGVMIADPKVSGRTFIPAGQLAESDELETGVDARLATVRIERAVVLWQRTCRATAIVSGGAASAFRLLLFRECIASSQRSFSLNSPTDNRCPSES